MLASIPCTAFVLSDVTNEVRSLATNGDAVAANDEYIRNKIHATRFEKAIVEKKPALASGQKAPETQMSIYKQKSSIIYTLST